MKLKFIIPIAAISLLIILLSIFFTNSSDQKQSITPDGNSAEHYLSASSEEVSMRKLQNQLGHLIAEIGAIKLELQELKNNPLSADDVSLFDGGTVAGTDLLNIYQQIKMDPTLQAKVQSYYQDVNEQELIVRETFFNDKEFDDDWSSDAVSYLDESIYSDQHLAKSAAQLSSSDCKVGVCKVEFNIPIAEGSTEYDKSELEHHLLVSISKKFPRASLGRKMVGSNMVFSGYIMDENTTLPEADHILSDGRITQDEIAVLNSILGR